MNALTYPAKMFTERVVSLEPSARKLYDSVAKEARVSLENGESVTANNVLTKLIRLQQITGGFLHDDGDQMQEVSTAKLEALEDIIETCCIEEEKKVVVFARFRAELATIQEMIEKRFAKMGWNALKMVSINGDTPIPKRAALIDQFQNDPRTRVFVGQIDACAEGITLNAATTTVYYSVNWNYAKYQQSQDRTHRIGVGGSCLYIHLTAAWTIDQKVMEALKNKEDISKSVVDNWRSLLSGSKDNYKAFISV